MTDFTAEAEAIFRRIAAHQKLNIARESETPDEVMFLLSSIDPSHQAVTLGLQNGDELCFGVDGFRSYFFPFGEIKGVFEKAVAGWFTGQTRLAYYWRGKRLVKIYLQVKLKNGKWQRIYTEYKTWFLPFLALRTEFKTGT